nr:bifunctional riboflavin kinase/FAD synthetase [Brackiella oedipodis]
MPKPSAVAFRDGCALTIGNFDGVHIGHQALLAHLKRIAPNLPTCAMTFEPHPREYFAKLHKRPEFIPTKISTLRDKVERLRQAGVDYVVLSRFNQLMAQLSPEQFVQKLLLERLNIKHLIVGRDFRFGHKREGNLAYLQKASRIHGFTIHCLEDILDQHKQRVSSSELRNVLEQGNLAQASYLLGQPYRITGRVIRGKQLGRRIQVPTMNIKVMPHCAVRSGVYVVRVIDAQHRCYAAVASLGVRPTVEDNGQVLLEVHLLDASINAYGQLICTEFLQFLRDEEKFPSLKTMQIAIQKDIREAQHYFDIHGL